MVLLKEFCENIIYLLEKNQLTKKILNKIPSIQKVTIFEAYCVGTDIGDWVNLMMSYNFIFHEQLKFHVQLS